MLGLIKKDLLVIKANIKVLLVVLLALLSITFQGNEENGLFIIPYIGVLMFVSTFSYDEFNNWNSYVSTLPNGRRAVGAKYIATIILVLILSVISVIATMGISYIKSDSVNVSEFLMPLAGTIFGTSLIVSILYPITIKFGALNGRIIIFVVVIGMTLIVGAIAKIADMNNLVGFINSVEDYGVVFAVLISALLLVISYFISQKIFRNKEF